MPSRKPIRRVQSIRPHPVEPLERRAMLAAGDLDLSFSGDGRASVTVSGGTLSAVDVALQSNGKTIVVGECLGGGPLNGKIVVARFDAAGDLDLSFGGTGTGIASTDYLEFNSSYTFSDVAAVAIQAVDDKIVVLGHVTQGFFQSITLTRFTADGLLDTTFSGDGKVLLDGGFDDLGALAADVAIQADGKIVLAATIEENAPGRDLDFGIARYNSNGTLDNSFSDNGRTTIGFGEDEFASSLTIDPNGRIIVVGSSSPASNAMDRQFAIARLNPGGGLDDSFSGDGRVLSRFTGETLYSSGRDAVVQPDGRIVISGEVGSATFSDHNIGLFRLNANGTGDPTFGVGNGQIQVDYGGFDGPVSMIIGQTGRLIVGSNGAGGQMTLTCLTANGQLDPVFSGDGKQEVFFTGGSAGARGLALAPDGKFVAAGGMNFATARLFDRRPRTISIGTFQPQMFEQGTLGTSFLVGLLEPQPTVTRVFIGTGGQANPPNTFPIRPRDYNGTGISFGDGQTSSTFVDIPAGSTFVNVVITPVDDALVEGDELATFGVAPNAAYDVALPTTTTLVIRDNDTAVPSVNASAFLFETGPQRLTFRFTQQVGASLSAGDFQITGAAGIPAHSLAYDTVTNTATLSFASRLPDGNFTARVVGAGVTNAGGNAMAADHLFNFFFVNADANRDRSVNIDDFGILASRFNQPGTFSQGDFDYSGTADIDDFAILAARFNTILSVAAPAPGASTSDAMAFSAAVSVNDSGLSGRFIRARLIDLVPEALLDPPLA